MDGWVIPLKTVITIRVQVVLIFQRYEKFLQIPKGGGYGQLCRMLRVAPACIQSRCWSITHVKECGPLQKTKVFHLICF